MSSNLSTLKEQAILKVVRKALLAEFQIGKAPDDPKKIIVAKLGDMTLDELRKALAKVRAYKDNEDGTPNKGKLYWENRIILALKVRTELEAMISKNSEFQKADKMLNRLEEELNQNIIQSIEA